MKYKMEYSLKDEERQALLEQAFPGFSKKLQAACEARELLPSRGKRWTLVVGRQNMEVFARKGDWAITFTYDEIKCRGFDPEDWNEFDPDLEPPEDVPMQCEAKQGPLTLRYCAKFVNGEWVRPDYELYPDAPKTHTPDRYRLWGK